MRFIQANISAHNIHVFLLLFVLEFFFPLGAFTPAARYFLIQADMKWHETPIKYLIGPVEIMGAIKAIVCYQPE